jgi:hypothetical protein
VTPEEREALDVGDVLLAILLVVTALELQHEALLDVDQVSDGDGVASEVDRTVRLRSGKTGRLQDASQL